MQAHCVSRNIHHPSTLNQNQRNSGAGHFNIWGVTLTETGGGQHPHRHVWRNTVWEDGLQDVAGESEGDDSQGGRIHDEDGAPQQQKPEQEKDVQCQDTDSTTGVSKYRDSARTEHRWKNLPLIYIRLHTWIHITFTRTTRDNSCGSSIMFSVESFYLFWFSKIPFWGIFHLDSKESKIALTWMC